MTKYLITFLALLILVICTGFAGLTAFVTGAKFGHSESIQHEMKHIDVSLSLHSDHMGNELRNYLKERYYYLSHFVSDSYIKDFSKDFGKPEKNVCRISTGKEAMPEADYITFTQRFAKVKDDL